MFAVKKSVLDELSKKYRVHSKGFFILAPSGSGKTYFIEHQITNDWIDGDYYWSLSGADYSSDDWNYDNSEVAMINKRCDVATTAALKRGFWIIGASNDSLKPDAVVIPDWDTHLSYIAKREDSNYDGGAKKSDIDALNKHVLWIRKKWQGRVPFFKSIDGAVYYLTKNSEHE